MEKTILHCASYFDKMKKDVASIDNKNVKQDYDKLREDINSIKRIYALKIRLLMDTTDELKHLVYEMADAEHYLREALGEAPGFQGVFQSTDSLVGIEWINLSHLGQMRMLERVIEILDDFGFFYGIYRAELQDMGSSLVKMRRDALAIKNNLWLEMDLDRKLNSDVSALYVNMGMLETRLNNLMDTKRMNGEIEAVMDVIDANNNIKEGEPQPGPGVVDVEQELREAAQDLVQEVQKDEGYESGQDADDGDIKGEKIDNN